MATRLGFGCNTVHKEKQRGEDKGLEMFFLKDNYRKLQFYRLIYFGLISFTWKNTFTFFILQMNINFLLSLLMHLSVIL